MIKSLLLLVAAILLTVFIINTAVMVFVRAPKSRPAKKTSQRAQRSSQKIIRVQQPSKRENHWDQIMGDNVKGQAANDQDAPLHRTQRFRDWRFNY